MAILLRCPSCRTDQSIKNRICMKCGKNLSRGREYIVVIKMPGGKWIKRVCGSNLDVAKAIEAKIKTEIREGKFIDKKKPAPTLDEVWEKYLEWAKVNKKSWKDDFFNYETHLKPRFGEKTLDKISTFDVSNMIIELKNKLNKQERPYAMQTIKHQVALLRRIFNISINWGLYDGVNPASGKKIEMPRIDNRVTERLTKEEFGRLLVVLKAYEKSNVQAAHLIEFAIFSGLRRGEIFELKWDDVDLENGRIFLDNPKGGKKELIPLNRHALDVLKNHPRVKESPYVFPGKNGQKRKEIKTAWKHVKRVAGIDPGFRFHGLRHAYASFLSSEGVDLYSLQKLMTHKTIDMTERYAHIDEKRLRQQVEVMDRVIEEAEKLIRNKVSDKGNLKDNCS